MIYRRCKCGEMESWSSGMPMATCSPCEKCGTIPGLGPDNHPAPTPHDFSAVEEVQTDDGPKTLTRCRLCFKTKAQIEAAAKKAGAP